MGATTQEPEQQARPVLVSACLAGLPCRFDSRAKPDPNIVRAVAEGRALAACAEQLGGLPSPRPAVELVGGDGHAVLSGEASAVTIDGADVSAEFIRGAQAVAQIAHAHGITEAILQARSPSCGSGEVYDGTHTGRLSTGDGVLTAVLASHGISVTPVRGSSTAK